jgi:hypothetical protein
MKSLVIILAVLTIGVSCSKVERPKSTSKEMNSATQEIVKKEADDQRESKLLILKSEKESLGSKIAAAKDYFLAFDFQRSVQSKNEKLLLIAVRDFKVVAQDFHSKIKVKRMSPLKDGENQSDEHAFYALAASLDTKSTEAGVSFYDLIRWALRREEYKEQLRSYEAELVTGKSKQVMIDLMKARMDIMATLALRELTDEDNQTLGQKIKSVVFDVTGGVLGSIDLPETFTDANDVTKDAAIKFLEKASKALRVLKDIGVEKKLQRTLRSAFSKIDLSNRSKHEQEHLHPDVEKEIDQRRGTTRQLIDELLQ